MYLATFREEIFRDPLLAKDTLERFDGTIFKLLNLHRAIESNRVYDMLLLPIELYVLLYVLGTFAELNVSLFIYLFFLPDLQGQRS